MAQIRYENIGKRFGSVTALRDLNLTVEDREFVTLVGPSGCGKSTTLNITAGLEDPSSGEVYIDGQMVNAIPPGKRDIAMVFQSYALYPHKTVRENIGFGLKVRKVAPPEIERRVQEAARSLDIAHLLDRKPRQLSGGQRQRVALGRAITRDPKVFLLDEPLSNLDAKLRVQMRAELKLLFERVQGTVLYVTHDQAEAMTLSDRVVVMNHGYVQQVGTPLEVYNQPVNKFVAGFLGSPPMNFIDCQLQQTEGAITTQVGGQRWTIPLSTSTQPAPTRLMANQTRLQGPVTLGIRPEDITLIPDGQPNGRHQSLPCQVAVVEPMGSMNIIVVYVDDQQLTVTTDPDLFFKPGETAKISINQAKVHFFEADSDENLAL